MKVAVAALVLAARVFAQAPVVESVLNAASILDTAPHGIAPDMLLAIKGQNLAGGSVTFNGTPAPLLYVSPTQINAQVPRAVSSPASVNIVVTTPAGSSQPVTLPVGARSFGIFTQDASGCGAGSVLNIHADGSLALNSTANSFDPARDTAMAVFFTGLGSFPDLQDGVPWTYNPADNVADAGEAPVTLFSYSFVAKVLYAGPAPGTVGVDQLNIMPDQTGYIESCHMPIYLASYATQNVSQLATVSIHTGGGVCVDPAPDSEGSITWQKNTVFDVGSTTATEGVQAKFLQGYGVELPNSGSVVGFGEYALPAAPPTNCTSGLPVSLNAGVLTVSGVTATPLTIAPQAGNVYPVQFAPRRLPEAHIR